jgi:hypothetical protein
LLAVSWWDGDALGLHTFYFPALKAAHWVCMRLVWPVVNWFMQVSSAGQGQKQQQQAS